MSSLGETLPVVDHGQKTFISFCRIASWTRMRMSLSNQESYGRRHFIITWRISVVIAGHTLTNVAAFWHASYAPVPQFGMVVQGDSWREVHMYLPPTCCVGRSASRPRADMRSIASMLPSSRPSCWVSVVTQTAISHTLSSPSTEEEKCRTRKIAVSLSLNSILHSPLSFAA